MIPFTSQHNTDQKAAKIYNDAKLTPLPPAIKRGKRVYVCSPYQGSPTTNTVIAAEICRRICLTGAISFAPHLHYTRFLDEDVHAEREMGIACGLDWIQFCDILFVWDLLDLSVGMMREIKYCESNFPECRIIYASKLEDIMIGENV